MKVYARIDCLMIVLFTVCGAARAQDRVKDLASRFDGKVSIFAKNLKTGQTYDLGGGTESTPRARSKCRS